MTNRAESPHALATHAVQRLTGAQEQIRLVPLASKLTTPGAWRTFMRLHVFAVYDFMSLLKRLQRELAGCEVPWQPPSSPFAARLINEIVLAEESDDDEGGGYCSHFELYRRAMQQAHAVEAPIATLVAELRAGMPIDAALAPLPIPRAVQDFVRFTLILATQGAVHEVAAAFLFGREAVLPRLFADLVGSLRSTEPQLTRLARYFERHIELDGDDHGPKAHQLLQALCGTDAAAWREATACAERSLALRHGLWQAISDAVDEELRAQAALGEPPNGNRPRPAASSR